ncbi:hypothetical protein N752_29885 [Desulforamulus aquiferis]|nr:hypothetical protein [Desulforamulus aquiferis]RYD01514.1 hypothetical protein N752_29885 [Desulforamulus aquiferis]
MRKIDNSVISNIIRNLNTKNEPCKKYPGLMMEFFNIFLNFFEYTETNTKAYEVAYG